MSKRFVDGGCVGTMQQQPLIQLLIQVLCLCFPMMFASILYGVLEFIVVPRYVTDFMDWFTFASTPKFKRKF
ncbi:hypothetical protein OESDEN_00278 [Oesophagostomum dentatum]|uniref:Uncharacterized protein n=1 Tax=Oesophagostomum dentatum TaxID=61180 RepID=A0A0B1TV46_OESDE|nr:hypothetical protein OESDEN_00278 [Oesophagostomum dentatum]